MAKKEVKWELALPTDIAVYQDPESDYIKGVRRIVHTWKGDKDFQPTSLVWIMPEGKNSKEQKVLTQVGARVILEKMKLKDFYSMISHQQNNVIMECRLMTRNGDFVIQGFGGGSGVGREFHKELVMAQKRAMVQAVMKLTNLKAQGWTTDTEPEFSEFMATQGQLDDKKVQHLIDIYNAVKKEKGEMDKETGEFSNSDFNKVHSEFMTFKRANNVVKNSISEIAKTLSDKDYQYLIELFSKKEYGDIIDGQMETLFQAYLVRDKA